MRNWGGEGWKRGNDNAGIGIEGPGLQGRNGLKPKTERGAVAVEQRREFENPCRKLGRQKPEIVCEAIGVWKPGCDGEDDFWRTGILPV